MATAILALQTALLPIFGSRYDWEKIDDFELERRGLRPHLLELQRLLSEYGVDVACISETLISPGKKIFIRGFTTYRHDQASGTGGGAVIMVRTTISHTQSPISIVGAYVVGVDINHSKGYLRVIACYNNPKSILSESKIDSLFLPRSTVPTIVAGDLNAKHSVWNCRSTNSNGQRLARLSLTKELTVEAPDGHKWFPTSQDLNSDILDIFITRNFSFPFTISNITALSSDHGPVIIEVTLSPESTPQGRVVNDYLQLAFLLETI